MKGLWRIAVMTAVVGAASCGGAGAGYEAGLRVSARDAYREARLQALSWDSDAYLRFVEGDAISPDGYADPTGGGHWRFSFDRPRDNEQLLVSVAPADEATRTRPRQSPPGYVVGSNRLGTDWIDSPRAAEAARAASLPADQAISMLLVPTSPAMWIVSLGDRRWRVNATSGTLIE